MDIHILLAGEQVGPFSEAQVRQYLEQGLVSPTDLAAREGMAEWQSIAAILAQPSSSPSVPLMISPQASSPETSTQANPTSSQEPSLTASQKTKRKLNKIVIQPILPLEATAPLSRKKPRTGKTTLTIEPLRPTTALPPVSALPPQPKKSGKTALRADQLSFGYFVEKHGPRPSTTPAAEDLVIPPAPSQETEPTPPQLPSPPTPPETMAKAPAAKARFKRIPRWMIYAGVGAALLVVGALLFLVYLIYSNEGAPSLTNLVQPNIIVAPSTQAPAPKPDAGPSTAADYRNRGIARASKGDMDGAILDFTQALSLNPKDVESYYQRGLARQAKGNFDDALDDFTQAIALDPKRADAFSHRGFIRQAKGDSDGAVADYNQALVIDPKISAAYYNEGLIQAQRGFFDAAIADYDHAIDLDPKRSLAYFNRGNAKNVEGNIDGAIADYTQALAVDPNLAIAYDKRGILRQAKDDSNGALADFSKALTLDPKLAEAYFSRAQIKLTTGDLDGAIDDSTRAIDLAPKNEQPYSIRGLAEWGQGDLDNAMADLKYFCVLAPRDSGADTARIYLWLIATEKNPQGTADFDLANSFQNDWNSPPEELISKIASFLLGHIQERDLIANAASPDPSREPGQYCKVWYFAGMKRLFMGDMTTAINYFERCLATGRKNDDEYVFAQAQLKTLGQSREVASKPGTSP